MQKRVGTPGYPAPEVVDCKSYGVKADIFSSGVLLYIMLSNTRPFPGPDAQTVIRRTCKRSVKFRSSEFRDASGGCKLLLGRLMSKEPKKWPTSQRSHGACWQLLSSPSRIPEEAAAGPDAPRAGSSAPARSAVDDPRFNPKSCLEQDDEMWRRSRWAFVRQARSNIFRLGQAVPCSNIFRLGQAMGRKSSGSSKSSHGIGREETSHQSGLAVPDNSSFNDKSSNSMNMSPLVAEDVGVNSQNSGKGQSSELEVLPVKPPSTARPAGAWYRRQRWSPVTNGA
ncbi:unnamed protein product [Polarella glacialis]|uniref:Protein kinase domain-containing protein n=1 Tax=Polarella glacialis TaxID=89957 RepID=A0A813GG69_POLGL|nr:unnamed protein product [Polarella glacialis]